MLKIIVVTGATASGKSDLAELLAEICHGEIVNADSMQVYKGMNIGTAKPSQDSMQRIPHHLFDIIEPDEDFTVADYCRMGRDIIKEICSRRKTAVITGGSGLYIKALLSGLLDVPGADAAARVEYNQIADREGNEHLLELLRKVDPDSASKIHANNRVRIIRALEVFNHTGRKISEMQGEHMFKSKWCESLKIGIKIERNELYLRINDRVDRMISDGLVAEVEYLLSQGYSPRLKSLSSIGYREICAFLADKYSLPEAIDQMKKNSRRYAKRQLTWFQCDSEMKWFESPLNFDEVSVCVTDFLRSANAP